MSRKTDRSLSVLSFVVALLLLGANFFFFTLPPSSVAADAETESFDRSPASEEARLQENQGMPINQLSIKKIEISCDKEVEIIVPHTAHQIKISGTSCAPAMKSTRKRKVPAAIPTEIHLERTGSTATALVFFENSQNYSTEILTLNNGENLFTLRFVYGDAGEYFQKIKVTRLNEIPNR